MNMLGPALLLAEMKRNQWRSQGDIREIAERKMLALLEHARKTVPFYRKRINGCRVRGLDGLRSIPLTRKTDVRDSPASFISSAFFEKSLQRNFTSGSTGIQVPLFHVPSENAYGAAFEIHHMTACRAGLLDRQAKITHFETRPNILQRLGLLRCSYLPVQALDTDNLKALMRMRPDILVSYPSILLPVARLNLSERAGLRCRMVFSGGEILSQPARSEISSSLDCPVYDRYGCMESSWAAWECPHGGLHIQEDQVWLEIVDAGGAPVPDGKSGAIALTPLWRRAMPFIRYLTGDRGAMGGPCRCGRGLRTLRLEQGREDDRVVLPSGRIRSARSINIMDDIPGILSYRIVQERPDRFVFQYVPGSGFGESGKSEVRRRILHGCLGEDVSVEFEAMQSIPRGRTGKLRAVVSRVRGRGSSP